MTQSKDTIYSTLQAADSFEFNQQVAQVFPDMIKRSVPGYQLILSNISKFAKRFGVDNTNCYDLGCSLGAASLALSNGLKAKNVKIIALDNSPAMVDRCRQMLDSFKHTTPIKITLGNLEDIPIENASMVVLNFTLQFIDKSKRQQILDKIYAGLNKHGVLILSEKICFEEQQIEQLITELHHEFKLENGYSQLEISQKRTALEQVLMPESMQQHISRLKQSGFSQVSCWLQHYNFASFIAIK